MSIPTCYETCYKEAWVDMAVLLLARERAEWGRLLGRVSWLRLAHKCNKGIQQA